MTKLAAKKRKAKRPEWVKVRRAPLSTDRQYPYQTFHRGEWRMRWPRHWKMGFEYRVTKPGSSSGYAYFFTGSHCHLCGDYDALMLVGNVERKTTEWKP